ncbi:MAG: hypothetical protein HKN55_11725, partial [Woeseiaceae bacterium]|nr:hypothetical protein [Woeseiaceae bacterium]
MTVSSTRRRKAGSRANFILTLSIFLGAFAGSMFGVSVAYAAPVCSTGVDGTVVIGSSATRVNVYYAAPDPELDTTTVAAGSTAIPIDEGLGPQATNL